ncbi:MAG: hypothetical protein IPG51_00700 [Chloroflexi bacterium]|nr:hypothetical protein [Chloroflexota bacterium]
MYQLRQARPFATMCPEKLANKLAGVHNGSRWRQEAVPTRRGSMLPHGAPERRFPQSGAWLSFRR